MASNPQSNFLAVRLRSKGKHLGRTNPELVRIAQATGLSVHMIQSLAMGRKGWTDETRQKVRDAIAVK